MEKGKNGNKSKSVFFFWGGEIKMYNIYPWLGLKSLFTFEHVKGPVDRLQNLNH